MSICGGLRSGMGWLRCRTGSKSYEALVDLTREAFAGDPAA